MAEAKVTGPGVMDMKLLAVRLREADPKLKRNLRRQLRDAATPAAQDVRQSILDMPAAAQRGLRQETAATVRLSTSVTQNGISVQISSLGQRMPQGKATLPRHLDSARGWKHPVFGNRDRWVRQMGKPGWFELPIAARARAFQAAAQQALDETRRELGA